VSVVFRDDLRPPGALRGPDFLLRPITLDDVERDFAAVIASRDDLRLWEQSGWPADDFTVEDNRRDVADLVERHTAGRAFTYAVTDADDTDNVGCVYVFANDAGFLARAERTPLGDGAWDDLDALVYFWVRTDLRQTGLDARVLAALRPWFAREWSLSTVAIVAHESFSAQVELLSAAGMRPAFAIRESDKPGRFLAFR
jgi:RimJ/RimL family protein N-acetyltransferase